MIKLVRDKVPKIIQKKYPKTKFILVHKDKKLFYLIKKLFEEAHEFKKTPNTEELIDLFEVLHALAFELKISPQKLHQLRTEKAKMKGRFKKGYLLKK